MKYKYIIAAALIAVASPSFAKGFGHAYHGSHQGKDLAYAGSHHGKGYFHNQAHGDHGADLHSLGKGHR